MLENQNGQKQIVAFEHSVRLSDRDAGTLMSLAYAYAAVGRRDEVRKFLEEAEEKTTQLCILLTSKRKRKARENQYVFDRNLLHLKTLVSTLRWAHARS